MSLEPGSTQRQADDAVIPAHPGDVSTNGCPAPTPAPGRLAARLGAVALLVASSCLLAFALMERSADVVNRDFMAYWSAGQLLARHSNPYDSTAVFRLQKSAGSKLPAAMVMRNPPQALLLALPLGFLNLRVAAAVWWLFVVACVLVSVRLLWLVNGKRQNRLHLFAYVFLPTAVCISTGQTSALVLLALLLFLLLLPRRPFWAGACLALCAIKPHLFLVFGPPLLLWVGSRRQWPVLAGAAAGTATLLIPPLWLDPKVFSDYLAMLRSAGIETEFVPTFGAFVRILIDRDAAWLQCLPAVLGTAWGLWYYWRSRTEWDWSTHGGLILLVSVLAAPYSWLNDEIIVLPPVMRAVYHADKASIVALILFDSLGLIMMAAGIKIASGLYVWTTPAWLIWYLYSTHRAGRIRLTRLT